MVLRNLPKAIERRVSDISADQQTFDGAAPLYQNALKSSGFASTIEYQEKATRATGRNRKNCRRKVIWFNPPFSKNVSTNVAATFLRLVQKHFPANSKLQKIFNKNNVKVSSNVAAVINEYNKMKLEPKHVEKPCNCRAQPECPLDGRCQAHEVVYEAHVGKENEQKVYIGSTEPPFKKRHYNHKSDMNIESRRNNTELSKHVWRLKETNAPVTIKWRIAEQAKGYSNVSKWCNLCVTEKFRIITADGSTRLNKRSKLISKCRHANKFQLSRVT